LYAHAILLYSNVTHEDLDDSLVSRLLVSHFFLAERFTWGSYTDTEFNDALGNWIANVTNDGLTAHLMGFPIGVNGPSPSDDWNPQHIGFLEGIIFSSWHLTRRIVITWLRKQNKGMLHDIFYRCVRISSGLSPEVPSASSEGSDGLYRRYWCLFEEESSRGRFTEVSVLSEEGRDWRSEPPSVTNDTETHGIELDIQVLLVTMNSSSVGSLARETDNDYDVIMAFPRNQQSQNDSQSNLQVAVVESCVNRMWYRVIGRDCDIQAWITPDPYVQFYFPKKE